MNKLDLQKKAVDIRKGIVSSVHSAKAVPMMKRLLR